jgi:hypothetical protein
VVIFTPLPLIPRKTALGTHWIEDWVGPRDNLKASEKRKISFSAGNQTPAVLPVAHRYTDLTIQATNNNNSNNNNNNNNNRIVELYLHPPTFSVA